MRATLLLLSLSLACTRKAEIFDAPDGGGITMTPTDLVDASFSGVDAGLDAAPYALCGERQFGTGCRGFNDFPCNFAIWVGAVARECQTLTGCRTNGMLRVDMGSDGCVANLEMTDPNADFVSCAVERFGAVRCECGSARVEQFLGLGNDGCPDAGPEPCGPAEFPCPVGQRCVDGFCEPAPDPG